MCSFSALSAGSDAAVREWNRQFSVLNNIPEDKRSEPYGLMSYYKVITANNRASGGNHFILPGEVKLPTTTVTPTPVTPVVGVQNDTIKYQLQAALKSAQETVKAIEVLIAKGI